MESSDTTDSHHQPLRRPSRRHIKHPSRFLLVLPRRRHMPHAGQRHQGKLQPFADLHGHHLNRIRTGPVFTALLAHAVRQLALGQGAGAQVHGFPVGAQHGHVAPGKAFFMGAGQVVGNGKGFVAQGGQFDDDGGLALAPAAHGFEQGDAVVVFVVRGQQVCGDQAGGVQYLPRVAVVDLQDGCISLGFDPEALPRELQPGPSVDVLRVVVKHQQAVGGGVHHLGDELEPFGRKVVALVDHHRLVLAAGDLAALHGSDDVAYQAFIKAAALGWQCLPVGSELAVAPAMKVPYMHAVAQAFGLHHAGQLDAQRLVKAEDEDGFAGRGAGLGQVFGAVAQDHGFA